MTTSMNIAIATLSCILLTASSSAAQSSALDFPGAKASTTAGSVKATVLVFEPEDLGFDDDGPTVTIVARTQPLPDGTGSDDERKRRRVKQRDDVLIHGYIDGVLVAQSLYTPQSLQSSENMSTGGIDGGSITMMVPGPDRTQIKLRIRLSQVAGL